MDSMAIRNSALALVFQYMKTHSCKSLELSRQYSLAEVESMVHDPLMFESAERERVKLEFSVYRANMGLVHHLIRKMGLDEAELLMHGQDALMDAIRKYDPEKGKFGAFAGAVIRNRLIALARRANRQVSLDREVGEGVPLMGLMGTADAGHEEYELKEIAKKALQALTPREREIIGARVGLDGNGPKTLEETGRIFNITREWARQIESRAKEKMRIRLKKDKILSF
jgi:RNA polymerase sigma factor (sigma-70 family)